jgi:hypothetical protein
LCPEDENSRFLPNDAKCQIARQNKTVTIKLIVLRISDAKTKKFSVAAAAAAIPAHNQDSQCEARKWFK